MQYSKTAGESIDYITMPNQQDMILCHSMPLLPPGPPSFGMVTLAVALTRLTVGAQKAGARTVTDVAVPALPTKATIGAG